MTEAALQKMAKEFPEEVKEVQNYLAAIKGRNVAVLGQDECFKLTDQTGQILAFRGNVHLSTDDGTLVVVSGKIMISAQGYERLNEATGTIVMNAPSVMVDGQSKENPYVKRDPQNNKVLAIYCRAIAFRYTPKGIPAVSDRTTIFDVVNYRLIDLLAKARYFPQAFRLLPNGIKPEEVPEVTPVKPVTPVATEKQERPEKEKEKAALEDLSPKAWAPYALDENTTLWVNTSHSEALQFYSNIINREKKAIDIAQTFAQRNAAKHIHNLTQSPKGKDWDISVVCWRPVNGSLIKWDQTRYLNAQSTIAALAEGKREGNMQVLELQQGTDYVSDEAPETIREALDPEDLEEGGEAAEIRPETEDQAETPCLNEPDPPRTERVIEDANNPIWAQLRATLEQVPDILEEAVGELGLKMHGITTVAQARQVMAKCNEIAGRE